MVMVGVDLKKKEKKKFDWAMYVHRLNITCYSSASVSLFVPASLQVVPQS